MAPTLAELDAVISKTCDVIIDAHEAGDEVTEHIARSLLATLFVDRARLIPQTRPATPHS